MKFRISIIEKNGQGFGLFPQAFHKFYLTCPKCGYKYELRHGYCGVSLDPLWALDTLTCDLCQENGQVHEAKLPNNFADCPKCGHKCRNKGDLEWNDGIKATNDSVHPIVKKKQGKPSLPTRKCRVCIVCGFEHGLEIHHKDWNHENNHPDNLQMMCKYCHSQAHKLGKPLFERMVERMHFNPTYRAALRRSAEEFYRKTQQMTINVANQALS